MRGALAATNSETLMPQTVPIKVADLDLDVENPRLEPANRSQAATALALAQDQQNVIVSFAEDVLDRGLDPLSNIAVVQTSPNPPRYKVIEGNRRVLAIQALETPSLVSPALSPAQQRKLNQLAEQYAQQPLLDIEVVLFDSEEEAQDWIERRHTGKNRGLGLSEWGSEMVDRYRARRTGRRGPAGQVLEFVDAADLLSDEARRSNRRIQTNVQRAITGPEDRRLLGIDVKNGEVLALYPADQIARSLSYIVEELKLGRLSVSQLYHAPDRKAYIKSLPPEVLPDPATKLSMPVPLTDAPATAPGTKKKSKSAASTKKNTTKTKSQPAPSRLSVIPQSTHLAISKPRINQVCAELRALNASTYPNACAVLLRVFLELSVDHVIETEKLMTAEEEQRDRQSLGKKLKVVAQFLKKEKRIPVKLATAIERIAGNKLLGPSVFTLHQFVHNEYVFPRAEDLFSAWDELAPFIEEVWAA
jgi:hypothetical protein